MHLLVIEDERALCETIVRSLRRLAYSVDYCYDGENALALLGVSWCVLTVFLSVRYRAANAMEIYPEEYSTVYRLCNVVPLLAAVLAALCVVF